MAKLTFITGGVRSGKSSYAQALAEQLSANPVYLATARVWDADFAERIRKHQSDRGENWTNIEEEVELSKNDFQGKVVLLDCITLWLTNIFHDHNYQLNESLEAAKTEWDKLMQQDAHFVVVSNELGMGVHPEHESARKFADLQGWMNQYIARQAEEVVLMVSGIAVKIK